MRGQNFLIFALVFALLIAIFSVLNVEAVQVNFLFTKTFIPLIIVIIASTLIGGLIVGSVGMVRQYSLQKENNMLKKLVEEKLGPEALEMVHKKESPTTAAATADPQTPQEQAVVEDVTLESDETKQK